MLFTIHLSSTYIGPLSLPFEGITLEVKLKKGVKWVSSFTQSEAACYLRIYCEDRFPEKDLLMVLEIPGTTVEEIPFPASSEILLYITTKILIR